MRRSLFRVTLVVGLLVGTCAVVMAQSRIGTVDRINGWVDIDSFGTGRFVQVVVPETVYDDSVIRTDYESWAYITIDGNEYVVGPNSTTPVSSFISDRRRERSGGFFARILREITRSLAPPEEEEIVAGGRAMDQSEGDYGFVYDVDANKVYEEALHKLDMGRFESAVESLRLIEYPTDGDFEIEEYYVNLSYALMGMGDFHAAMSAAFEYAVAEPEPDNVDLLSPRLQLLGGVCAFYAGNDEVAAAAVDAYLADVPLESAAPEAVAVRYAIYRDQGDNSQALQLLRDARRAQPDVDWNAATGQ